MTEQRTGSMPVATAAGDADGSLTWERVFPRLPCPIQKQLLDRMATPGGLTTQDLKDHLGSAMSNRAKSCVDAVVSGQGDCLPNFEVPATRQTTHSGGDAIHSPDIALIGIRSSTNPTPMLVEIAQTITEPGRRLLVVTPTAKEAVAFLDRWTTLSDQSIGLALHPKENSSSLSKTARAHTTSAHTDRGWTTTRNEMQHRITELRAEHGLLKLARKRLPELQIERDRLAEIEAQQATLADDGFWTSPRWADHPLRSECETTLAALSQAQDEQKQAEANVEEIQRKQTALNADNDPARSNGGLLRKVVGLFRAAPHAEEPHHADHELAEQRTKLEQCQSTVSQREAERDAAFERFRNEAKQQCQSERQAHEATIAAILQELRTAGIEPIAGRSNEELADAIDQRLAELDEELPFAQHWLNDLTEQRGPIDRHGLKLIPVTVAPFSALGQDPLTPSRISQPIYDTVLIVQAEQLGSEEFERIATYAESWILVGQPNEGGRSRDKRGFFDTLWQRLDIPLWRREANQRIARLDRSNRTPSLREPLADQPEIELRFAKDDDDELILVEVAFPADWSLARGKAFLATELEEVRIETVGPGRWSENDAGWTITWTDAENDDRIRIDLGSGITEEIVEVDCQPLTVGLHFDRDSWDQASARDWIDTHRFCRRAVRVPIDEPESPARRAPSVRPMAEAVV